MADSPRNALRAGLFIVGASLAALAVVVVISGPERFSTKTTYVAAFTLEDNLQGVRPGTDVRLGGVRVGSVSAVELDDAKSPPEFRVSMSVPARFKLGKGSTVAVEALIGSASLNITSVGDLSKPLGPDDVLRGQPSMITQFAKSAEKVDRILEDVRTRTLPRVEEAIAEYKLVATDAREKGLPAVANAADEGRKMLEHVRAQVQPVLDRYFGVADAAKAAATNIGDFIGPREDAPARDFRGTMSNLQSASSTLKTELPELTKRLREVLDQANDRMTALKGTVDDLRATVANAREITGDIRMLLEDNKGRIERIIASLEGTASNAKLFTAEVVRRPSRLIWRDDPKTQNNLDVYFSARRFAEGAQELNDAAANLRDLFKSGQIDDAELRRRLDALDGTFQRFQEVENRLYESVKK